MLYTGINCYSPTQEHGNTKVFLEILLRAICSNSIQSKTFEAVQSFTWLGPVKSKFATSESSYDGLSKLFLTIDSGLCLDNIKQQAKILTGLQTSTIDDHFDEFSSTNWYDNHVSLLINILRLYLLLDLAEKKGLQTGRFPPLNNKTYEVDVNNILRFPDTPIKFSWPGGCKKKGYPKFEYADDFFPTSSSPYVDLRALDIDEARIVLFMTGEWKAQTNFKVDFDSSMLCNEIFYRYRKPINELDLFYSNSDDFRMPKSHVVLSALRKYVVSNCLYYQFHVASDLISQLMLTIFPENVEGMTWLQHTAEINLPLFGSIRGRYPFLCQGENAISRPDHIKEWALFVANPYLLFSRSLVLATCFNIGLAVRDFKVRNGLASKEAIESFFLEPDSFYASAISLATGSEFPKNEMTNACLFYPSLVKICGSYSVPISLLRNQSEIIENDCVFHDVPFVGSPYTSYPIAVFDDASPYSGKFSIPTPIRVLNNGAIYSPLDTWKLAWLCQVAGYELQASCMKSEDEIYNHTGRSKWFPLSQSCLGIDAEGILVTGFERIDEDFIYLPNFLLPGTYPSFEVEIEVCSLYLDDKNREGRRAISRGISSIRWRTTGDWTPETAKGSMKRVKGSLIATEYK
ncbi:hypothetical protein G9P44_002511 [Scheffersomyces stipitis]|nr:hypothetical protein G9P44_002511 [Scheffersomyces stipitis]